MRTSPRKKPVDVAIPIKPLNFMENYVEEDSSHDSKSDEDVLELTRGLEESPPKQIPF